MRKFLLLAVMDMFMLFTITAQKFNVTPDGIVDESNANNNFIVIKFDNKTASELYSITSRFINEKYKSPKNVISANMKDEMIKTQTYVNNFILLQKGLVGEPYYGNCLFVTSYYFKDGKVKFEINDMDMKIWSNDYKIFYKPQSGSGLVWSVFKSNGKQNKDYPEQIKRFLDLFVSEYIAFVNEFEQNDTSW